MRTLHFVPCRWLRHCLVAFAFLLPAICMAQIKIELRQQAQIAHSVVTLGDVANITTHSLSSMRELMALPLGSAPTADVPVSLERKELERWVAVRLRPSATDQIQWSGSDRVELKMILVDLSGDSILKAAREALLSWLKSRAERVEVMEVAQPRSMTLPQGVLTLRVRPLPDTLSPTKRMMVWVDILIDEQFVKSVPVSFQVHAYRAAWVAKKDLSGGSLINSLAVESRDLDVTQIKASEIWNGDLDVASLRLRHFLRAGDPVSQNNVEIVPAVARGERVMLRTHAGIVSLESQAEVLQDGVVGQMVKVKAPSSSGAVLVRVTGVGKVEMIE
jgi:flagellar basal body P-ring formation protein FlgA